MTMDVLFFGPIGSNNRKIITGGGEAGNIKTLNLLNKLGLNIYIINKPYFNHNYVSYIISLFWVYLKFTYLFVTRKTKFQIHISGFYSHLIYFEFILILICRLFGKIVIYELRAGGVENFYTNNSHLYKFIFRNAIKLSNYYLCQGQNSLKFVEQVTQKIGVFYPNFILNEVIQNIRLTDKFEFRSEFKMIHFGRLVKQKNIDMLVDIFNNVKDLNISLEIIGDGDMSYIKYVNDKIEFYGLSERIKILGKMKSNELFEKLKDKHFFLFPSSEKREGQSNALTEAMVFGIIPLASDIGFNRFVIGNEELIVENCDIISFSDKIREFVGKPTSDLQIISNKLHKRVIENFSEVQSLEILKRIYIS